ncbi:GntR family transcriptional regulator [Ramlibacter sp.]|uniref:GntR family transcriptional regulator n=1 Tax=Ramlibacter sp. TaxID=1917967 RepID=UPI00262CC324|nr:GntR family transcriptional regulator [Ramlibacter sp.]
MTPPATKRKTAPVPPPGAGDEAPVPPSLRALAYERFRQQILAGHLRAGQFVSQRELVKLLAVPLGAVREMIPRLEAARLLVTVPKRGLQIAHIDLKLIRNAFQVRSMIEREAVLHYVRTASDEELDEEERQHRAVLERALSGKPDPRLDQDALAVDWQLHDRMVDAMGNEILSEIYRANSLHVRMIRLDAQQVRRHRVVPAMEEHLKFIALLKARDQAGAVQAMQEHVEQSRQRVLHTILREGA